MCVARAAFAIEQDVCGTSSERNGPVEGDLSRDGEEGLEVCDAQRIARINGSHHV